VSNPSLAPNAFALPEALGWECNDEIKASTIKTLETWLKIQQAVPMSLVAAEIMDNTYTIIKKYEGLTKQ